MPQAIPAMLILAALLQVVAAVFAVALIPVSGMRVYWLLICMALILQAWRRVEAVYAGAGPFEAISALVVSALLLAGIVGIRAVFGSLRRSKLLLDRQAEGAVEVANRADAAIVVIDPDGCVRSMNDSARRLLHWEGRPLGGVDWFATFVPPEVRDERREAFERLLRSETDHDEYAELMLQDADGHRHTSVWHRRLLRDADGNVTGVRAAGVGMSDGDDLQQELAFRSLLLDHTTDSVIAYRPDGRIVYANDTACAYRGMKREQMVGADIRQLIPARERDAFEIHLETVTRGSCVTYETEATAGDIVRPLESHVCPTDIGDERLIIDVGRDVTERREAEVAIRRLAYWDHLTGLPNRVLLTDRAGVAMARARRERERLALMFMDLDRVKYVNDTLGHAAGDELLKQVGERLAETFRGEDTVARVGGDEFVALVRTEDGPSADSIAWRVIELISQPYTIGGEEVYSSVSVGIALFPDDGADLEDLVAKADAAMYVAKEKGRGGYRRASAL